MSYYTYKTHIILLFLQDLKDVIPYNVFVKMYLQKWAEDGYI